MRQGHLQPQTAPHFAGLRRSRNGNIASFARPNANGVDYGRDEDLTVADFASSRAFLDHRQHSIALIVGDDHYYQRFRQQVDLVLRSSVMLSVALLATGAADLDNADSMYAKIVEPILDIV
jgi:hypothetical protein